MIRKLLKILFWITVSVTFLVIVAVAGITVWGFQYITRDLPNLTRIEDYRPASVSKIYDDSGNLIGEFYDERRYPVKLDQVPKIVQQAFLASEDATFYSHPGIDLVSIVRAFIINMQAGSKKQGGSTITQQVVKRLLLTPEKDYRRKIKEAILSYRLEQKLTKDEILEIYLNEMFFGNTAYGIKAATQLYFHKELQDLTLAEAALLAGLLKAPSRYSPVSNMTRAKKRQRYVLNQMLKANFIDEKQKQKAYQEDVKVYRARHDKIKHAPYYVGEVRRVLTALLGSESKIDEGGYIVETAANLKANQLAKRSLQRSLREVDKRRGWRGAVNHLSHEVRAPFLEELKYQSTNGLESGKIYKALVTQRSRDKRTVWVDLGGVSGKLNIQAAAWARRLLSAKGNITWIKPETHIRVGDVIEVSLKEKSKPKTTTKLVYNLKLDQTPDIEGALVLLDPNSGKVVAMQGGYDHNRSVFNRVTQSRRQPGSAFKPVVYLAATDGFGYTATTIVYDEPRSFRVGDEYWTPGNFDDRYMGGITLRRALEKSRNLVSADIISRIGVDSAIDYARKLGIKSPLGRNLSLSLGSSEVTLLELTRAYGVFAAKGFLFDSVFVTKITDRDGRVVYDYDEEILRAGKQVIPEESAFIIANMMKGVVESGTGYRVKALGRPTAGKTGTSNDQMDAWFVGYTPEWVCGVWSGFDLKKKIGDKETGGRVSAPSWLYFMQDFYAHQDKTKYEELVAESKAEAERLGIEVEPVELVPVDFSPPDKVNPFWINKLTGEKSDADGENAFYEYFINGTAPNEKELDSGGNTEDYLESAHL